MATDLGSAGQPSLTVLLKEILNDIQDLFRQQLVMFKTEIKSDIRKTGQVAALMAAGMGGIAVGGMFFLIMLPLLLNWLVPTIPLWGCFGIVGAVVLAVGGVLVFVGIRRFKSFDPLPTQSVEALKENLQWTTHPK